MARMAKRRRRRRRKWYERWPYSDTLLGAYYERSAEDDAAAERVEEDGVAGWLAEIAGLAQRVLDGDQTGGKRRLRATRRHHGFVLTLSPAEDALAALAGVETMDHDRLALCPHCGGVERGRYGVSEFHAGQWPMRATPIGMEPRGGHAVLACVEQSDAANVGCFIEAGLCALVGVPVRVYGATYDHNRERIVINMSEKKTNQVQTVTRTRMLDGSVLEFENLTPTTDEDGHRFDSDDPQTCRVAVTDKDGKVASMVIDSRTFATWTRTSLGSFTRE